MRDQVSGFLRGARVRGLKSVFGIIILFSERAYFDRRVYCRRCTRDKVGEGGGIDRPRTNE